eukprot:3935449-Rhodomonas_salina.2
MHASLNEIRDALGLPPPYTPHGKAPPPPRPPAWNPDALRARHAISIMATPSLYGSYRPPSAAMASVLQQTASATRWYTKSGGKE